VADYRLGRHLPLGPAMLFLQPLWEAALIILPLVVLLLFPDGRLPSPRWRPALWLFAALCAVFVVTAWGRAASAIAEHNIHLDASGDLTTTVHSAGWTKSASGLGFVLLVLLVLSFAGRQALSWRRSSGERRQQLKWLVAGAAVSVVSVLVSVAVGNAPGSGRSWPMCSASVSSPRRWPSESAF
jgi:two-component system NarL family sensor kinase